MTVCASPTLVDVHKLALHDACPVTFAVLASAALWSAGFARYAVSYRPVLTRLRVDGKPG